MSIELIHEYGSGDEISVDLFAGGGGASTGIEAAIGKPITIAINHCREAIEVHKVNHPQTRHYQEDVWQVSPRKAVGSRKVKWLWMSSSCFPAGTMVLTKTGYRAIEQIQIGEEVLTHKNRWRQVTATLSTVKPLLKIRGYGHPEMFVSAEHPFLVRKRKNVWNNDRRSYDRCFDPEQWLPASEIDKGWYWASPTQFPPAIPPPMDTYRNRTMDITPELMWIVGRYLADGWLRIERDPTKSQYGLVICCGKSESEELNVPLAFCPPIGTRARTNEIRWRKHETRTTYNFVTASRCLVEWINTHFGRYSRSKRIPGWALGMSIELRRALLAGYLSGDGSVERGRGNDLQSATSVSKALIFGIKALAASLGKSVSVYVRHDQPDVIEGRKVNVVPAWSAKWREPLAQNHAQTYREGHLEWAPVRERVETGISSVVYNLSVDEDESYVAEGLVVHNCTAFSKAKSNTPLDKNVRSLSWVGIRWAREVKPDVVMGENVYEQTSWAPLLPNGRPDPSRKGDTWRAWVAAWHDLGYQFDWWTARASDFGIPTSRNRLYFCARRDGKPIVRPNPTHGKGLLPYVPASSIIDFSLPSKSIFDRKKPLVPATLKRLAAGLDRFVFKEDEPVVMERGGDLFLPWIAKHCGGPNGVQTPGLSVRDPLSTVTAVDHHALVQVDLVPEDAPLGEHEESVIFYICKYFKSGTNVVSIADPLPTITTHDRFGLVSVHKKRHRITDIRMRMFSPEELKLAMGFPREYALAHDSKGKPIPRGKQIMLVGNAVCPPMAQRIVEAQMRAQ